MKLFIIRHGDPDYANDTLTDRGWEEARLLCDRLMGENITKVYLSPLGRAQDTAKPFLEASGLGSLLVSHLNNIAPPLYWQMFRIMPTSVTTLRFYGNERGEYVSKTFMVGDVSHLAPIGLTYRG